MDFCVHMCTLQIEDVCYVNPIPFAADIHENVVLVRGVVFAALFDRGFKERPSPLDLPGGWPAPARAAGRVCPMMRLLGWGADGMSSLIHTDTHLPQSFMAKPVRN